MEMSTVEWKVNALEKPWNVGPVVGHLKWGHSSESSQLGCLTFFPSSIAHLSGCMFREENVWFTLAWLSYQMYGQRAG